MKQPLCRYCGKPIPKWTRYRYLTTDPESMKCMTESGVLCEKLPQTKAEAQKLFNEEVVSVQRAKKYDYKTDSRADVGIDRVTIWDRETYVDEFFCNGDHAKRFGYAAARAGQVMKAYQDARDKQEEDSEQS